MSRSSTILFSGGGSLGHVVPSIAVAEHIRRDHPDCRLVFVCANRANEIDLLSRLHYSYRTLCSVRCPRGLTLSLFTFPFLCIYAHIQAWKILQEEQPSVIFSKGGFASVPIALNAFLKGIPIVLHESDSVMSLSSRLIAKVATSICMGFPDVRIPRSLQKKYRHTGNPIRTDILRGAEAAGQRITGFSGRRPVVMVIGGSQGSVALNRAVEAKLHLLVNLADIIHLTGEGKMINVHHARYFARTAVIDELPHLYALADIVVSRAGAGVLSELAALKKPVIVTPLAGVAHDHQVHNAEFLKQKGAIVLLKQERIAELPTVIHTLLQNPSTCTALGNRLSDIFPLNAAAQIAEEILGACA